MCVCKSKNKYRKDKFLAVMKILNLTIVQLSFEIIKNKK